MPRRFPAGASFDLLSSIRLVPILNGLLAGGESQLDPIVCFPFMNRLLFSLVKAVVANVPAVIQFLIPFPFRDVARIAADGFIGLFFSP